MLLRVDTRETSLHKVLEGDIQGIRDARFEIKNLELGDAGIYDDEGKELILFERKSLADLAASIKDGRYAEQSYRLAASETANHNIVYIVEGSIDQYNHRRGKIHHKTLQSAMVSLNYFKGFSVIRTWSVLETAEMILRYFHKVHDNKEKRTPYYPRPMPTNDTILSQEERSEVADTVTNMIVESLPVQAPEGAAETDAGYASVVKRVKKDNITVNNIVNIMLCQIPNVSIVSAKAISDRYSTMEQLITACKEGRTAFDTIKMGKTSRRLSSLCIRNVICYILGDSTIQL